MFQKPAFIFAFAITIVWLLGVGYWLLETPLAEPCNCDIWRVLCPIRELDLNEAGDFFAGVFSALAFLWLASAVILQGIELGNQQKEFMAMRMAAEAQVQVAREKQKNQTAVLAEKDVERLVCELFAKISTNWPKTLTLYDQKKGASKKITIWPRNSNTSIAIAEQFITSVEKLWVSIGPLSETDMIIKNPNKHKTFFDTLVTIRGSAHEIIGYKSIVSESFANSNVFTALNSLSSICSLILNSTDEHSTR